VNSKGNFFTGGEIEIVSSKYLLFMLNGEFRTNETINAIVRSLDEYHKANKQKDMGTAYNMLSEIVRLCESNRADLPSYSYSAARKAMTGSYFGSKAIEKLITQCKARMKQLKPAEAAA
jgi:hypothetical protein